MRKVFKISVVMFAVFALLSLSVLSVGADSLGIYLNSNNFDLEYVNLRFDNSSSGYTWYDYTSRSTFSTLANENGKLYISTGNPAAWWRAKFNPKTPASMVVSPYMSVSCNFFYNLSASTSYVNQTIQGALYLVSPSGLTLEFPIVSQNSFYNDAGQLTGYNVQVGGSIELSEAIDVGKSSIELIFTGISSTGSVDLLFTQLNFIGLESTTSSTAKVVESIEKGFADLQQQQQQNTQDIINNQDSNTQEIIGNQNSNTQDIIGNQNSNTQDIIGNQNSNTQDIIGNQNSNTDKVTGSIEDSTDEIVNGWGTDDDTSSDIDDFANDLQDAESDALGGKTDGQIQNEVNNALHGGGGGTFGNGVSSVSTVFNNLIDAFGVEYESLLYLSLALGFSAFLIGRSYRARGD